MIKLPFLKEHTWPKMAKPMDEAKYGYSDEDNLLEEAAKELLHGLHSKDVEMVMAAVEALVRAIKNKYSEGNNEVHEET